MRFVERRLSVGIATVALATVATLSAQPVKPPTLEAGRALTSRLRLDPAADAPLFASAGYEGIHVLLQVVIDQGQQPSATPEDWKYLHRAVAGMAELCVWNGEPFRASLYDALQNNLYMNLDHDFSKALEAAQQGLALQEQSKVTNTLYIPHSAVGHDLFELGRSEEAVAELRLAHQLDPEMTSAMGAMRWRDVVQAHLALGHIADAQAEMLAMEQGEAHSSGLPRGRALLARADVELARRNMDGAVDAVAAALGAAGDEADPQFSAEAVSELMVCILDSLNRAAYPEAIELGNRIAAKIHGLSIDVPAFARQAILARRRSAGDLDGVLRDYSADLAEARRTGDIPGQIETLRAIGVTYGALHARTQRVAVLEEALVLETAQLGASGVPASYPVAYSFVTTLNNLGSAYNDLEDVRAASKFQKSLQTVAAMTSAGDRQRLEDLASEARIGLARAAEINFDPDSARDIFAEESKQHPDSPWIALAWARMERNAREQPVKAADLYERAASLFYGLDLRQNEVTVRLEYARYLAGMGLAKVPNALTRAQSEVEYAARLAVDLKDAEGEWQLVYTRGMIAEAGGRKADAVAAYRDAVEKLDRLRSAIGDESRRQAFADSPLVQDLYSRLVGLLAEQQSTSDAWKYLEQQKARAFVDVLTGHHSSLPPDAGGESAEVEHIRDQIVNLRADMTGEAAQAERGAGRSPAYLEAQLHRLEASYVVARERSQIAAPASEPMYAAKSFDGDKLRRLLQPRSALLEFGILPGKLAAFVATRDGVRLRTWPVADGALRRIVLRLRLALKTPDSTTELDEATAELSRMVLAPIAADIPANVNRLVIVPAAELHQTPFQALRMPNGQYLVDRFAISYIPAASALAALGQEHQETGTQLLAAIGDLSVDGMPALPGTLLETKAIVALEPASKVITQSAFTHDAALQALTTFDQVHFATHGILDPDVPLFSALLTSPAQGQPSRLALVELLDRKIRSRLVVMSACETGLGHMSAGDEITGLTRTFLASGAKVVVSSLWRVSDESTATLMQEFYRGLKSGSSSAESMRAAEIEVRKHYSHPYYWAAFVVTGAI